MNVGIFHEQKIGDTTITVQDNASGGYLLVIKKPFSKYYEAMDQFRAAVKAVKEHGRINP